MHLRSETRPRRAIVLSDRMARASMARKRERRLRSNSDVGPGGLVRGQRLKQGDRRPQQSCTLQSCSATF
eukprot:11133746-Alexandrium_andersonii.AAC.1